MNIHTLAPVGSTAASITGQGSPHHVSLMLVVNRHGRLVVSRKFETHIVAFLCLCEFPASAPVFPSDILEYFPIRALDQGSMGCMSRSQISSAFFGVFPPHLNMFLESVLQ